MALKDWIKKYNHKYWQSFEKEKGKIVLDINELKDDTFRVDVRKLTFVEEYSDTRYVNVLDKRFKTHKDAESFAKDYMRSH
jgi:hypothetical protein